MSQVKTQPLCFPGAYRQSDVYLVVQPAAEIENKDSLRYFTGLNESNEPQWSESENDAEALFDQPCVGEFSVVFNEFIDHWVMLYNCDGQGWRGINMRTALQPWGPWSEPKLVFHPFEDDGYCHFMHQSYNAGVCDQVHDRGRENEWGGEYGPYIIEELTFGDESQTTVYFTMSTWNPYTVVLMKTVLEKVSE